MTQLALYAVCLGGRAPRANVELHDVAFAVGESLEACHDQLLSSWFGASEGLHVDAYVRLDSVDGHRIELSDRPADSDRRLFFVNIGGYVPAEFGERHAWAFYVGKDRAAVKRRAKQELLVGKVSTHRDDLHAVDDLIVVDRAGGLHVHLLPDADAGTPEVVNGYFPLPRQTILDWRSRHPDDSPGNPMDCRVNARPGPRSEG